MIHLIDLSSNQPITAVNAVRLRLAGIRGAHVRCGSGLYSVDQAYATHRAKLCSADIRTGAYFVVRPSQGAPRDQAERAEALQAYFAPRADDLPLGVDLEESAPGDGDFMRAFLGALNCRYVVYCNTSVRRNLEASGPKVPYWQAEYHTLVYPTAEANVLAGAAVLANDQAAKALKAGDQEGYRKYLAAKAADGLALSRLRLMPRDSGKAPDGCWMHQFGGDANASTVDGVDGFCDRSVFLGTEEEFTSFTLHGSFGYSPARPLGPSLAASYKGTPNDIQNALKCLGFYDGPIDGLLGPKSLAAIKAFQTRVGLKADGIVGPKTSAALVVELNKKG